VAPDPASPEYANKNATEDHAGNPVTRDGDGNLRVQDQDGNWVPGQFNKDGMVEPIPQNPAPNDAATQTAKAIFDGADDSGVTPADAGQMQNLNNQAQGAADLAQTLANQIGDLSNPQNGDNQLGGLLGDLSNSLADLSAGANVNPALMAPARVADYSGIIAQANATLNAAGACAGGDMAACVDASNKANALLARIRNASAGRSAVSGRSGATSPPPPSNNSTITSSSNPGAGCGGPGVPGGCSGGGGGATSPTPTNNNQATGANATEKHVAVGNASQPINGAVQSKVPSSPSTTVRSTAPSLSNRAASTAAANAASRAASSAAGRAASNAAANTASRTASNAAANAASRAASNAAANAASRAASNVASRIHLPTVSDIRLKRDVAEVGQLPDGLHLYRFRYLWSDTVYVGVMAQEALAIEPEAVVRGQDGYLRVDYDRIGFKFSTWSEWVGRAPERLN
jgi:hypothetical protein